MSANSSELNQGVFDAALEIAARRADTLRTVKELLEQDEDRKALKVLREFFGMKKQHSGGAAVKFPRPAPHRSK